MTTQINGNAKFRTQSFTANGKTFSTMANLSDYVKGIGMKLVSSKVMKTEKTFLHIWTIAKIN